MANTLKISQNYDNPYEAAYNMVKGNPWFNQEDWDVMAKRGNLDDYLTIMQQTDKLPDLARFNDDYRPDLLDTNRRFTAMANELYGDRENHKARTEIQFDPNKGENVEVALGEMSDYNYTKYLLTQYKDWQLDKIRVKEEQERKDAMSAWSKTGAFVTSIPADAAVGAMDFVDYIGSLLEGVNDGLDTVGRGGKFSDGFRQAYTNSDWEIFNNLGWSNAIREWERKYSSFRDIDGNYTNVGKVLGGVSYSLGQALPSMSLNLLGAGLGKLGVDTGNTMSKAATALYYTGLGSGSFKEMVNDPRMTSVPTWQLMANASIKMGFQYLIQRGLENAFGQSQLDSLIFGKHVTKAAGEATMAKALNRMTVDFVHEGLEELGQDFSDFLWDQTFGLAVNKKFGQLSTWNMQTAFDAFILGGLSTIATNVIAINTTRKINLGDRKLRRSASWVFKGDLQSMMVEYNKVLNDKKLTDEQRLEAVGQMYASYRTIASVYGEIGKERFDAATKLLQDMKEASSKFTLATEQIQANAKILYDSIADMHADYNVMQDIIKAGMTKKVEVINREDDIDTSTLSDETKKKVIETVKAVFDADKNIQRVVITEDGTTIVRTDNAIFAPIEYTLADNGKMILDTDAEISLVNNVIAEPTLKPILATLKNLFEHVTNRTNVDMSEVVYNVFFNDNFYKVALQVSNSDMLKVLSALETIALRATDKTVRDAKYKKKITDSMTAIKMALANYLVLQQNAPYKHLTMLTKEQKAFIARRRWSLDLANRIIAGEQLTADDIALISSRVNSMPAEPDIKQQVMDGIKSTDKRTRQLALQVLEKYYRDVFNSPYNGRTYLTNDTVPNVMFNEFIKAHGLTIDTLLQPISKGQMYNRIMNQYGEVTGDTLLKYYQEQFLSYTNDKYSFSYTNGNVIIKEQHIDAQHTFNNFNKSRGDIYNGKNLAERTITNIKEDTSGLLNNVIGNSVSSIHKSYMTIQDVIFNPRFLTLKMQNEITKQYRQLTPMNTFLYLRQYYLDKYKTTSITILANGGFAFVDVSPMLQSLKHIEINQSMITDKSTARDFFNDNFLQGRLGDVKIVLGTDSYYDVQKNTITLDKDSTKDPAYFRFALLHEFQHAIQTENQLNGGINADWLNLSGMNKTQKAQLIVDVKKHMPDLFKDVPATDLRRQLDIVNKFVYDTSGESQAFGVDTNNKLVDFYPTVVRFIGAKTTITMPWGTKYTFDGTISADASLSIYDTEIVPESEHSEYSEAEGQHWKNLYREMIKSSMYRDKYKLAFDKLRRDIPEIDDWARIGSNIKPNPVFGEKGNIYTEEKHNYEVNKKQNLLNKITPEVKAEMLEAFRLKILPEIPMEQFLNMDIPYVRMQVKQDVGNDPFVSIALGTTEAMSVIARMFPIVKERYIFAGTIKPKDLLGVIPSSENEGLVKPSQLGEARKYTAEYAAELDKIRNIKPIEIDGNPIQQMSMAKFWDTEILPETQYKEFAKANRREIERRDNDTHQYVKDVQTIGEINDKLHKLVPEIEQWTRLGYGLIDEWNVDTYQNGRPKVHTDKDGIIRDSNNNIVVYTTWDEDDPNRFTNPNSPYGPYSYMVAQELGTKYTEEKHSTEVVKKQNLLNKITPEIKSLMLEGMRLRFTPDVPMDKFLNMDIPYVRLQVIKDVGNDPFVSVALGEPGNMLGIANMFKSVKERYLYVGIIKPKDLLGVMPSLEYEGLLKPEQLKNAKVYSMDYLDEQYNNIQQMSMAKQPGEPRGHKWKTRVEIGRWPDGSKKYKYTYDKHSYTSNRSAVGTNLEYFVKKNKQLQPDPDTRDFIINADPSKLDPELWSMIGGDKKGTLTKDLVYEYLRKANKVDNYTFELINEHFFQNDYIKTFDQLDYLLLTDISKYYALRGILKQFNSVEATDMIYEEISHLRFKEIITQLSNMPQVKKQFEKIVTNYEKHKGHPIDVNYNNLRLVFMRYFDGTIDSAAHAAAIGKMLAINHWNLPGEHKKGSLDGRISDSEKNDLTYADVIADTSIQDAIQAILAKETRTTMEEKLLNNVLYVDLAEQIRKEVESSKQVPTQREVMKRAAKIKSDVEALSDQELKDYYIKMFHGDMVSKRPTLEEMAHSAPMVRSEFNISKNIRTLASKIKNYFKKNSILKNDAKNIGRVHSDLFNEDLSLKSSVLENVDRDKMLQIEDRLRTINIDIRNGAYHDKKMAKLKKHLEVVTKRLEREKYKNFKNSKRKVKEVYVNFGDHEFTIDTTTQMPKALKTILSTSFEKLYDTDVKFFTGDNEKHIQMRLSEFLDKNAMTLSSLLQADVDDIVNFYINSLPRGDINSADYVKYNAVKVYMLAYLLDQVNVKDWTLSPDQIQAIENHLKTIAQSAGTDLAVWRSVLKKINPNTRILNSLAKMSGIEFQDADVEQISSAIRSGDIAKIKVAMANLYDVGLKQYNGSKRSFWNKAWRLQRMFMLSGPGTAIRNLVSNTIVTAGNTAGGVVGNLFSKIPAKYRKNLDGQYKIVGTKVSQEVQSYIQTNIIDNGLLSLITDGLNKYDVRKANNKTTSDIMTDLVVRSVVSKIFNANQFDNKTLQKMSNFVFKVLSDDPAVNRATLKYFGKMLQEDGFDVTKGLNEQAMVTLADAYTLAARDYMHKPTFFNKLEQGIRESGGDVAFFMYKQLLPFASTSWSWFKEGLMYTPIGLVKGIIDFARLETTVEKMENKRMRGEQIESSRFAEYLSKRNMGKGIIGSIGMGIGLLLGAFGVAGIDEEDDKVKLRIGDVYVDITGLFGNQSILLGIALTNPRNGDWQGLSIDVLETMFSDSTMTDLFNTFRYSDSFGDWLINEPSQMLGTMIPNFVKGVSKLTYNHKVQYSSGILAGFERIATSIPGVAYMFPTKIDPYTGEKQSKYKIPFLYDAINTVMPIKMAEYNVSDIEKTALELGVRKGNLTGRYSDIGNFGPEDINKLNTKYGELNKVSLTDLYNNKGKYRVQLEDGTYKELRYDSMTAEQRKSVIERIMSNNAKYAKVYVYTSKDGMYYASTSDYEVLRRLGIKNVYKETPKKKGFN